MSNLLKRASIINKDERVIDYNRIIQEKLDALKKAAPKDSDGFIEGLHSPQVEQMVDEDGNPVDMSILVKIQPQQHRKRKHRKYLILMR